MTREATAICLWSAGISRRAQDASFGAPQHEPHAESRTLAWLRCVERDGVRPHREFMQKLRKGLSMLVNRKLATGFAAGRVTAAELRTIRCHERSATS